MAWSEQQGASATFVEQQRYGFIFQNDVFQVNSEKVFQGDEASWESQQGASTTFVEQQEAA